MWRAVIARRCKRALSDLGGFGDVTGWWGRNGWRDWAMWGNWEMWVDGEEGLGAVMWLGDMRGLADRCEEIGWCDWAMWEDQVMWLGDEEGLADMIGWSGGTWLCEGIGWCDWVEQGDRVMWLGNVRGLVLYKVKPQLFLWKEKNDKRKTAVDNYSMIMKGNAPPSTVALPQGRNISIVCTVPYLSRSYQTGSALTASSNHRM